MNKVAYAFILAALAVLFGSSALQAQEWSIGGRAGISSFSEAGFQFGPTLDYQFQKDMLLGTDLTINSQGGTPIGWHDYFKYLLHVPKQDITPYLDGGFNLWFVTGGPYFGLQFGGGVYFKIAPNLYVPADVQFGPVFTTGSNTFYFAATSGIRYTLPK
jgi:hypothetical protein